MRVKRESQRIVTGLSTQHSEVSVDAVQLNLTGMISLLSQARGNLRVNCACLLLQYLNLQAVCYPNSVLTLAMITQLQSAPLHVKLWVFHVNMNEWNAWMVRNEWSI